MWWSLKSAASRAPNVLLPLDGQPIMKITGIIRNKVLGGVMEDMCFVWEPFVKVMLGEMVLAGRVMYHFI